MKQTAVEWLRQELLKRDMDISIKDLFEQAKEMEKEQMESAYLAGESKDKQYYNETFKNSEQ
jgi:hypothetical protein